MTKMEHDIPCRICENQVGNQIWDAEEKMFGLGGSYHYLSCGDCQCLQLLNPPEDFSPFYPSNYYSYRLGRPTGIKGKLQQWVRAKRANLVLRPNAPIPTALLRRFPNAGIAALLPLKLTPKHEILDVGCGNGDLLFDLAQNGFEALTGVDPFVEADIYYPNGAKVLKQQLGDTVGKYDLIMMHHAFEHLDQPLQTLLDARDRLKDAGILLIRIPVANAAAWHTYGTNWVQLDAPRHLYLHTEKSMRHMAKEAGLALKKVVYDGTDFQFWGSETYKAEKKLVDNPAEPARPSPSLFNKAQLKAFRKQALLYNALGTADQAAFYLEKLQ